MDLNKHNLYKLLGLVAFGVLLNFSLQHYEVLKSGLGWIIGLLAPFLLGAATAFILNTPMRFLERTLFGERKKTLPARKKGPGRAELFYESFRRKMARPLSLALTLALVAGVIFVVIFLIVPEMANTFQLMAAALPGFYSDVQEWISVLSSQYPEAAEFLKGLQLDWQALLQSAVNFVRSSGIFSSVFGAATSVVSGLVDFFIGLVFAVYLLMQKEKLGLQCRKVLYAFLPKARVDRLVGIARLSSDTFSRFLSGQCLEAMILGTMFFIAMTILRFPYALLIGVLVAFTALIPIFGAFIGCIVGAFLILMVDPVKALWFVVLFLVLQQLEGNLIYPKVVGNSVGLPSIWVLAAVSIGGSMMGVVGMLVFIPLCSVLYTLLREATNRRLRQRSLKVQ